MQKKAFLDYIHHFRGLAIVFIVGLHACVTLNWDDRVLQRKSLIVLFNNGTLLFVFIAGYLFYHLNKDNFNYAGYLRKKVTNVILPYLFVSIPALLDKFYIDKIGDHWWMDYGFADSNVFVQVFFLLITGRHMGVFWFIPMITIIYLASPVILRFARSKSFLYIVPLLAILGLFTFRFGYYANILLSLEYFVPVYLFGIWVYRMKEYIFTHARMVIIILGSLYLIISFCELIDWVPFSETIGLRDVKYTIYRFNWNKFKMHLFAIGTLTLLYRWNHVRIPVLKILGDYSFGIFFVHLYIIQVFRLLDRGGYFKISPPNIITFALYFIGVMLLTVGIVKLVRLSLKNNSRYVIGS